MTKERLSVLICGALLFAIPTSVFAVKPGSSDINVGTIYFADGTSQSTAMLQGPAGPAGPAGQTGPQGPAGANGYNSLILITDELSGSNCANGGIKIQVGLDQDRSGALDLCEVLQTQYMCNGTTAVTPTPAPITVTASPSTQTANLFTNITATVKNADGTFVYGSVSFVSSGSCMLYGSDNYPSNYTSVDVTAGIASIALTNTNTSGGPCVVYANYYNPSTLVTVSGSTLATFVPDSGTTPLPPAPAPITVTASPSTQTANLFTNITATVKNADGTPAYGSVSFVSSGSCMLYGSDNYPSNYASVDVTAGIASIALTNTNTSGGPCVVYANYYNPSTQIQVGGSALATFVP